MGQNTSTLGDRESHTSKVSTERTLVQEIISSDGAIISAKQKRSKQNAVEASANGNTEQNTKQTANSNQKHQNTQPAYCVREKTETDEDDVCTDISMYVITDPEVTGAQNTPTKSKESNRQSHSFAEQSTEIPKNQTFLSRDGHISPRPTQSQKHQITQVVAETSLSKEEPKTEIQPDYHVAGDVQVTGVQNYPTKSTDKTAKKKKRTAWKRESENEQLRRVVSELEGQLSKRDTEVEELKTRLSQFLGDRLTDNNPNVADLSDLNRPTKIAERFSELYDNEWTNAFETLTADNKLKERKAIRVLFNAVKIIYDVCSKQSIDDYTRLQTVASEFAGFASEEFPFNYKLSLKVFKDSRKHNYAKFLDQLKQKIHKELGASIRTSIIDSEEFKAYFTVAAELCWLMCIQDPPVVMVTECRRKDAFDKTQFRPYKRNGVRYLYPVWPALLLHKDGGILMKGVAQPK